jgi:hypothetical protein
MSIYLSSNAALRILSCKGEKAPSLPNKDLPDFNGSIRKTGFTE